MITYQFDQCFNDADVIEECRVEGKVAAEPFPARLAGTKDPELIPLLVALGNPAITLDGRFLDDNASFIPDAHPGFVIICFSYKVVNRQFTSSAASRILHDFKSRITSWFEMSIRNSVVAITERTIDVFHVESGRVIRDWGGRYKRCNDDGDESDWIHYDVSVGPEISERLASRLKANEDRLPG